MDTPEDTSFARMVKQAVLDNPLFASVAEWAIAMERRKFGYYNDLSNESLSKLDQAYLEQVGRLAEMLGVSND